MIEEPEYSKRETDIFLADLRQAITRNEMSLVEITAQTKKTNGAIADVKSAQQFAKGALSVLSAVILVIILPMSAWLLSEVYSMNGTLDKRINSAINIALTNYGLIKQH